MVLITLRAAGEVRVAFADPTAPSMPDVGDCPRDHRSADREMIRAGCSIAGIAELIKPR